MSASFPDVSSVMKQISRVRQFRARRLRGQRCCVERVPLNTRPFAMRS